MKEKTFNLSIKTIVAIGIGAAVFTILAKFVSIPTPVPNTSIQTSYGFLGLMAVVFGPIAGALIGFIGHALNDAISYGTPWWSWVGVSGLVAATSNIVTVAILGTLLLAAYAKTRSQTDSLTRE